VGLLRRPAIPKSCSHLMAHSSKRTLAGVLRDALLQLEGAFSLVFLAEDRNIGARSARLSAAGGFGWSMGSYRQLSRPMRLRWSGGKPLKGHSREDRPRGSRN
jgi:hypothetical protein